ncbi:hypothetical protein JCM19301_3273 [Jejuia pallidilutea]|uniref:Uncharacterized protein n=1 Tax=Jejuia pallidilutea TaxID=504487 RepID=A0A090VVD4_9FLAO|nr:hypothetical protein JCM19301_3273 [Jejuia pallidilutea]
MFSKDIENYWSKRYQQHNTGWDIGVPSTPLKTYIDQTGEQKLKNFNSRCW